MPGGDKEEKTEQPTSKRRQEARRKGQVAQSREISSVFILLSALGVFSFLALYIFQGLSDVMRGVFQNLGSLDLQGASFHAFLLEIMKQVFMILVPILSVILFASLVGNLLQVGFLITGEPLRPKFSKFNPLNGLKNIVSSRALVELIKSIFKLLVVGSVGYLLIMGELENFFALTQMSVGDILSYIGRVSFKICLYTSLVLIVLAALDYVFQRWKHEQSLKMTKQEVRDEMKAREGDPTVKSRIRSVQREMARRRMMEAVPEADVVVTNPTRLAIALKYDAEGMMAPQVIAKGAGFIAERIKQIAEKNGIPIVEHKPLAQTLFKAVEIGEFIPVNLYRAVAEILAYVYRLRQGKQYNV
jgi:flagellar biosynthetic protein FlhB